MGQFGNSNLLPQVHYILDVPTWPEELQARFHNKFVRAAIKKMAAYHLKEHIPIHFQRRAAKRYGYQPRHPKYIRYKQRRWRQGGMDLVKTGASRRDMAKGAKIQIGGAAVEAKRQLSLTIKMRFAFPGGGGRFRKQGTRQAVSIDQMADEVRKIIPQEAKELRIIFRTEYFRLLRAKMSQRKRKRRRIGA